MGDLAVDATGIYWAKDWNSSSGVIMKANLDGSNPATFVMSQEADELKTDGVNLYWRSSFDFSLTMVSTAGGTPTQLVNPGGTIQHYVLGPKNAFYTAGDKVFAVPLMGADGGAGMQLAWNQTGASGVGATATNVYWTQSTSFWGVPIGGGMWMSLGYLYASDFVIVGSYAYGLVDLTGVVRLALAGGKVETLANPMGLISKLIAGDAKSVYFTLSDLGVTKIMRLVP
jgi:hypothetical protein